MLSSPKPAISLKPKYSQAVNPKKKCRGKSKWSSAEEAAMIATLLVQKQAGNASESSFKPSVWSLVVAAVEEATTEDVGKDIAQCKTCYHKVSRFFSIFRPSHSLPIIYSLNLITSW